MSTPTSPFDLNNKVVLITGGTGFLGKYFVEALSQAGASVVIADINGQTAITLANEINEKYKTEALGIAMDVTKVESIAEAFAAALQTHPKIDVVINNAAIDPKFDAAADKNSKLFENYPEELLRQSLDVNLLGYVLVAQETIRHMLQQKQGHIVNISSMYGLVGPDQRIYPDGTQKPVDYAITKGGVIMLTKWLATTYGSEGIRANTYTLGGVFKGHGKDFIDKYGYRTPLDRMANPKEVGGPLVFLASDASSYMTGANLLVDGGWTAW